MKPPSSIKDGIISKEMESKARQARAFRNIHMKNVLSTESGRIVLRSIIEKSGFFADPHVGMEETMRFMGSRRVGVWLRDWIFDADIASYVTMIKETESARTSTNRSGVDEYPDGDTSS